jgi:hypothetical protein
MRILPKGLHILENMGNFFFLFTVMTDYIIFLFTLVVNVSGF